MTKAMRLQVQGGDVNMSIPMGEDKPKSKSKPKKQFPKSTGGLGRFNPFFIREAV